MYWHQLTDQEQSVAKVSRVRYKQFKQPPWCHYPEATAGVMGCWSLVFGYIHRRLDCKGCSLESRNERMAAKHEFDWDCSLIHKTQEQLNAEEKEHV